MGDSFNKELRQGSSSSSHGHGHGTYNQHHQNVFSEEVETNEANHYSIVSDKLIQHEESIFETKNSPNSIKQQKQGLNKIDSSPSHYKPAKKRIHSVDDLNKFTESHLYNDFIGLFYI